MTIDERLDALRLDLEFTSREIQRLRKLVDVDTENIRTLLRIAESREFGH